MSAIIITPKRFADARGWFSETWNSARYAELGITASFIQDNHSYSAPAGTLRGLHFQREPHAQAKLVRCVRGRIFDVAVDVRAASPTYRQWVGVELSAEDGNQLFVPAGYAHGFMTLQADCEVVYKVNSYYAPESDGGIAWDDPDLGIDWPRIGMAPVLSEKDAALRPLSEQSLTFAYDGNPLRLAPLPSSLSFED